MQIEGINGNPWASLNIEKKSPRKISRKIIDNRFPNNFNKSSSIVTCNICQVLFLKSQTLHHFRCLHNKKLSKRCSKLIIPYNAIEVYDLITEHKAKKLLFSKNHNINNKNLEFFQIKHQKIHTNDDGEEITSKIETKVTKSSNDFELIESCDIFEKEEDKIGNQCEKINSNYGNETEIEKFLSKEIERKKQPEIIRSEKRTKDKYLNSKPDSCFILEDNSLRLNIKVTDEGVLASDLEPESNIFDRISAFSDNSWENTLNNRSISPYQGILFTQNTIDQSYGYKILTDQHSNSILMDNDKDNCNYLDYSKSFVKNSPPLCNLKNAVLNSFSTSHVRKTSNLYDSAIAPPLVTAHHHLSTSNNTVSYNNSNCESYKGIIKPTSAKMLISRNSTENSISSFTKTNVKHRFYVSSHSNQNILESIRKSSNLIKPTSQGFLKGSEFYSDSHNNENAYNFKSEDRDFVTNNSLSEINGQLNQSRLSPNVIGSLPNNSLNTCDIRYKITCPFYTKPTKYSSDLIINSPRLISNSSYSSVSDNLLSSYRSFESNGSDGYLQSDIINNSSENMFDYPFPDRNQRSFQQRLLERGVISQRDIARSQKCISLNNHSLIRKNIKLNPNKQIFVEDRRFSKIQPGSLKNQIMCQIGHDMRGTQSNGNKNNFGYNDQIFKDVQKSQSSILLFTNHSSNIIQTNFNR